MVVTQREVMVVVDVPVDASKNLVVFLVSRETGPRACVISVLVLHMLAHSLKVVFRTLGNEVVGIGNTILRSSPAVSNGWSLNILSIGEEE